MTALERARAAGQARAAEAAARIAAGAAGPGVSVTLSGGEVTIVGRGVLGALRWPAGLAR